MAMSGPPRDADSFYVEDCRLVQTNTTAIQTSTGMLSRMVSSMQAHDVERCRNMVDEAVKKASETREVLLRIKQHQLQAQNQAEKNNRMMMYKKLGDNLSITARVLEDVVRRFSVEESKFHSSAASSSGYAPVGAGDVAAGDENQFSTGAGVRLSDGGSGGSWGAHDAFTQELKQDRQDALQRVSEDMMCLQQIYTDLAKAAEDQQSSLDTLESHMINASGDLELGVNELDIARQSVARTMKQRLVIGATAVLGLFVVSSVMFGN